MNKFRKALNDFCKYHCPEYDECNTNIGCTTKQTMEEIVETLEIQYSYISYLHDVIGDCDREIKRLKGVENERPSRRRKKV